MNQRKDNYRAALRRGQAEPQPHTPKAATLNSRYVRITIELEPDLQRHLDQWTAPAVALLTNAGTAALRVLSAFTTGTPSSGAGSRT
ncbi:hypothetical protein [Streptomyces sp. NPDC047706]|uniref:hypothetical protein n=1 Tax=Streptomyces sp. NPDC047706 TaxID=3365486 RepID=UPI00372127E8